MNEAEELFNPRVQSSRAVGAWNLVDDTKSLMNMTCFGETKFNETYGNGFGLAPVNHNNDLKYRSI